MANRLAPLTAAVVFALAAASCDDGGERPLSIDFQPLVGGGPFACTATFTGLGSGKATARPLDFRLYVHDVSLITALGEVVPVQLENDGVWQRDGVALLDFEDDTGSCETGSSEVNRRLRGQVPDRGDYAGLRFKVGIPSAMNHLDAATAPAPFNAPGMWWSWQGGFKYMKVDLATDQNPEGYFYHLGGTNCDGTIVTAFACQFANLSVVDLPGFVPGSQSVALDIAPLYEGVDVNAKVDFMKDFVPGCMAFAGDPECPAMFAPLGLVFEASAPAATPQKLFSLRSQ
jgi:uncharacterized repeat protein (TIGR04052 family)